MFRRRLLFVLFLFLSSGNIYSQSLEERIQGQWICDKIIDSKGNISSVNELIPSGYLRYSFDKNKVFISDAPFSVGSMLSVDFRGENSFLFYSNPKEQKGTYDVKLLDGNKLILTAANQYGEPVDFIFSKLKNSFDELPIDNGLIVIEHFKKSQTAKVTMRSSLYIYNDTIQWKIVNNDFKRSPTFKDNRLGDFGDFLAENFVFPPGYQLNVFSEELIIDFNVTNNEINNIKIIKGLGEDIDNVVISLIQMTSKKWTVPELNHNSYNLRFHLRFLLGLSDAEPLKSLNK